MKIVSPRLTLEAITLESGKILMTNRIAYFLKHQIPFEMEWPSNGFKALLPYYLEKLEEDPTELGFGSWIILENASENLIGNIGFKGRSDEQPPYTLDIGYEILPKYRNQGYATEAVKYLTEWALEQSTVEKVTASCDISNTISQRVLINNSYEKYKHERSFVSYQKTKG
ncbi:GNAT family N-acetyltransferase [Radiobacillus kanasensis]|uniref:GNAT family N-acetyltransferase n=1 Tax=Radiobacillus kanasensis TaxID=2844358 RepID=UPI001E5103D3|nr:GNAT family N-acetyltransferase [Radiobacillus kanasensis]UFU00909.1 GNAT family N-acetyltransferase [Radiobacillus kanasensis]